MPIEWANTAPGAEFDWYEFIQDIEIEGETRRVRYKLNLSWLMSKWQCRYGECPGVLVTGARTDVACCQIGVEFVDQDDYERVSAAVKLLTAEDADYIASIKRGQWRTWKIEDGQRVAKGTKVVDGGCIFANRTGGPAGKPGCALHHLATRLGRKTWFSKPDICWQIPMAVLVYPDEYLDHVVVEISGSSGALWGHHNNEPTGAVGYWCTETPDAYQQGYVKRVYQSWDAELVHLLGEAWEPARRKLAEVHALQDQERARTVRPMPGSVTNDGRPMLPLLVQQRVDAWKAEGNTEALAASASYLEVA